MVQDHLPQEKSQPVPGQAWWMVVVFFITALISYSDRMVLSVLVDPLRRELGLSDSAVSLLQGIAFTLVYVFTSLPVGRLADRGNRKLLLCSGATIWCIATAACGLAPNFSALFVGRLVIGVGEAVLVPTAISMIADTFPAERRGLAIGLLSMGTIIGGPLGISVGGLLLSAATAGTFASWPLIGALSPWRQVLLTMGIGGLLAPLLLLTIRNPIRRGLNPDLSLTATARYFAGAYRTLLPLYAALALLAIGDYGLLSWAPTILFRRFAWTADQVGVAFGLVTASCGILGAVAGGWISDLADKSGGVNRRLLVCVLAALLAGAAAALVSAPLPNLVLAAIGLWTLASAVAGTGGVAALQEVLGTDFRATGMAVFTFTNTLVGLGAGPTLVALVTDHLYSGPTALPFAITSSVGPAALVSMLVLMYARRMPAYSKGRPT